MPLSSHLHSSPEAQPSSLWGRRFLRWGLVLFFVPFLYLRKEWYPFTHFPMYASLGEIWTLQLTDQDGNPLDAKKDFKGKAPSIRKLATGRLELVRKQWREEKRPEDYDIMWKEASGQTLNWLLEEHPPHGKTLKVTKFQIWRVEFKRENGQAVEVRRLMAERPAPPPPAISSPVEPKAP